MTGLAPILDVYLQDRLVGKLDRGDQRLRFRYHEAWLGDPDSIPLSVSLPLQEDAFEEDRARPFFANLLPDAGQRTMLARILGVSEENDLSLLAEVGGDCAGAVSLLPEGVTPVTEGGYEPISEDVLARILTELPRRPLATGWKDVRLSLAGAQPKLPLHFEDGKWYLPRGRNASTVILKPALKDFMDSVPNEAFCMRLAARMGLRVPEAGIVQVGDHTVYRVQRFDRLGDAPFTRLHQEDFCQALGVLPDRKYEKEGGPGFADAFAVVNEHSMLPLADRKQLLKWIAFNTVIGNADAHAKNLALLYHGRAKSLAPFYDLVCTAAWEGLTNRLAMSVGGEARWDWVQRSHWQAFADAAGLKLSVVEDEVSWFAEMAPRHAEEEAQEFARIYGDGARVSNIVAEIARRARRIESNLQAV